MSSSATSGSAPDANSQPTPVKFELSDVAKHGKPLGVGKYIRCVCVGSIPYMEVVNPVIELERLDASSSGKLIRLPLRYRQAYLHTIQRDEVLNGKTRDSNSNFFAKHMFDLGIEL